jgi:hypothetical protein
MEVNQKMQALKVKEKLMRLPSAHVVFSKINAVVQTTKAFIAGSEQTESAPSYEMTPGYRASQLEAERLKAKAEEFAQNLQRRFM